MDIAEFVKARLDEDEAALKSDDEAPEGAMRHVDVDEWSQEYVWRFTDEGRVKREIAAKRGRLALMTVAHAEMDRLIADEDADRADQAMAIGRARGATVAVKYDAAVWSDHPDYLQKWAPRAS
jgi:predicted amino acid dehydrogenase